MDSGVIAFIAIVVIRALIPLSVFRWPLVGGLLCIAADASDVITFEKFGSGPLTAPQYHNFDKIFDIYYLSIELLVALRWRDALAKRTALILFLWRFAAVVVFELLGLLGIRFRPVFLLAPNVYENFYLGMLIIWKFKPQFRLSPKSLAILLLVVTLPKLAQEYVMHYRYPDQTWHFLRDNFFRFLYQ